MASLLACNTVGLFPFKLDAKDSEQAEHVEFVENVHDVQLQAEDIHLESLHVGSEQKQEQSRASLLTLPVEIRLRIYEMAYDATFIYSRLEWETGLKLRWQGGSDDMSPPIKLSGSPFTLLRVCRKLHHEVLPMLPSISQVALQFSNFSEADMRRWLELLSDAQIAQARSFELLGWSACRLKHPLYADGHHMKCRRYRSFNSHYPVACTESCSDTTDDNEESITKAKKGLCNRSLTLDLNAFERQFQAERFARIVENQPTFDGVDQAPQREFQKACYLLRVLDGCVSRPRPTAHPAGRNSQCGTLDAVEAAVAGFVSDEGGLIVTKDNILSLLKGSM